MSERAGLYLERELEGLTGEGGEDADPALLEDVVELAEHRDLSRPVTSPATGLRAPVQQGPKTRLVRNYCMAAGSVCPTPCNAPAAISCPEGEVVCDSGSTGGCWLDSH